MIKLNGVKLEFKKFPNGETLIDHSEIMENLENYNLVSLNFEDDSDFIKLMFIKRHLDSLGNRRVKLELNYVPYSRMDRSEDNSVFTLKYISEFINSLNFNKVFIVDPHSDVTEALINNNFVSYKTISILNLVLKEIKFDKEKDYIYFPDASAEKKYGKMIKGFKTLTGFKKRDFKTGNILSLEIFGEIEGKGRKVVMLDDLCSRGGTFVFGSRKLASLGASEIYLVVGHCENTIYDGKIFDNNMINRVYTTNSIINKSATKKIVVYDVDELIGDDDEK